MGILSKKNPDPDEPLYDRYLELMPTVDRFRQAEYGGFDYITALRLVLCDVSPSEVRERWVKRGASRQQIEDYFLGKD